METELFYIFGVSAIGAASIAYIFFGPSPSAVYNKNVPIRGLKNVKNNCFINAILQSMANSPSLVNWLTCANITSKCNAKLVNEIFTLVTKINENNDNEELTPHPVLNALREHDWVFSTEEQDAYELWNILTSTIENEFRHFSFMYSIQDLFQTNNSISNPTKFGILKTYRINTRVTGETPLVPHLNNSLPTRGMMVNHLICRNCNYKYPLHLDVFDSITLNLVSGTFGLGMDSGGCSLENCLDKFVSTELIHDFLCEACKQKSIFDKKVEFIKLPQLLCFHIQRMVWLNHGEGPMKMFTHVNFPELLEMDPFTYKFNMHFIHKNINLNLVGGRCNQGGDQLDQSNSQIAQSKSTKNEEEEEASSQNNNDKISISTERKPKLASYVYTLNSVIVHLGNSTSGHFITYRRKFDVLTNRIKWYYISDQIVKEVSRTQVLSSSAYMLFYERNWNV